MEVVVAVVFVVVVVLVTAGVEEEEAGLPGGDMLTVLAPGIFKTSSSWPIAKLV